MNGQKSLAEIVSEKIDSSPYIKFCLSDGLINYSALARHYMKDLGKTNGRPINEESLTVAIKRYAEQMSLSQKPVDYSEIFSQVSVGMHEDMVYGVFEKTEKSIEEINKLLHEEKWEVGEIRSVTEEPLTVTALIKKSKLDKLREKIEGKLIKDYRDFSMITMKFPKSADKIYGTIALISSELAKKGICILMDSNPTDIYILVDENRSQEAYLAVKDMLKKFQKPMG